MPTCTISRPSAGESNSTFRLRSEHGFAQSDIPGIQARRRSHRRTKPRPYPARRRSLQRRVRSRGEQHQGNARDSASVRTAAIRRGSRAAFQDADRHRFQSQRRRSRGDRHRGRLGKTGRRRHRRDGETGLLLRHRRPRRHGNYPPRLQDGEGLRAMGLGIASRGAASEGSVGIYQVRGIGYHVGNRRESLRGKRLRQALRTRRDTRFRRNDRAYRRRAARRRPLQDARGARQVHVHVQSLSGGGQPPQNERPHGFAADEGQYRRRPHHHRGEGARQHPEDR